MKQNKNLDQILQQALSPDEDVNERLNQKILSKIRENEEMNRKPRRIPAAAMAAALTLFIGSATAVAAWHYMTPDKVAEVMEDEGLMKAFQSEDAITLNESQICGDLKITLLGMVSGKDLSSCVENVNQEGDSDTKIEDNKTYIVTAIEKVDETANTLQQDLSATNIIVSPLVKGLKPWQFNIYTMEGGCAAISENGIEYRITESDNIEIFADRGLYLAVTDGVPSADAYEYEEATGEITRNESYEGINALFHLPIDANKADREAADKYLKEMENETNSSEDIAENIEEDALIGMVSQWSIEEIRKNAELLEDLTQVLTPDAEGMITTAAYELNQNGMAVGEGRYQIEGIFQEQTNGNEVVLVIMGENEGAVYIETVTLNEDGTVALKVYYYKE